jgi:hypothetical protein
MRFRIPWARATTFGFAGLLLAVGLALSLVGWVWGYLPATLATALAIYGTSTALGRFAERLARDLSENLLLGMSIGFVTLMVGTLAFGLCSSAITWIDGAISADLGWDPYVSIWSTLEDFVYKPVLGVLIYGSWLGLLFGAVYGAVLPREAREARPRDRKSVV